MNKVYIIGNSGFAKEVKMWAERNDFEVMGLIGEKEEEEFISNSFYTYYFDKQKIKILLGVGNPKLKNRLFNKYAQYGLFEFPNLIDKSVVYNKDLQIGVGNIICPGNIITTNVKIGSFVTINLSCTIGHDAIIEDFCSLMPQVSISGHVHLGKGSYVGAGAVVLETQFTEENVIIGGQALVNKSVCKGETVIGVPARPIGVK